MKKVIGSVSVLAALVLVGYYGMGLVTERTLKKDLVLMDQSNGLSVQIANYDRGLFTSKVKLVWQMQTPERFVKNATGDTTLVPSKAYTFDMPITIYHGPVIYAGDIIHFGLGYANSQLVLPDAYVAQFTQDFTADSIIPKLDLKLFITYLNKTMLHVDIPAFRLVTKEDNSQLDWLGMTSEHTFSSNMNDIEGDAVIEGVKLTQGNRVAIVEKVNSTYDLHRSPVGLYLGDMSINVPLVTVTNANVKEFEIQSLQATSNNDVDDGLFSTSIHAAFEKMLSHDHNYGPGRLSFAIKNLDAGTLVNINQKMNEIQRGSDSERQQAALAVLPDLPKLFGRGATIEISELNVVGPDGEVDGSLHISLPKGDAGNPFQLIQKIEGEGKIKMPSVLLKSIIVHAEKNKILTQMASTVEQQNALVPTVQQTVTPDVAPTPVAAALSNDVVMEQPSAVATLTANQVEEQATTEADKCIARLIKVGTIVLKDSDFLIDVKLAAGQFSVNGHPLNAEMLQF